MTKYISATYEVKSPDMAEAAHCIAMGQSLGNPHLRTPRDKALMASHGAVGVVEEPYIRIRWPAGNFGPRDGINHFLCLTVPKS